MKHKPGAPRHNPSPNQTWITHPPQPLQPPPRPPTFLMVVTATLPEMITAVIDVQAEVRLLCVICRIPRHAEREDSGVVICVNDRLAVVRVVDGVELSEELHDQLLDLTVGKVGTMGCRQL